jgi:hypothetical protein
MVPGKIPEYVRLITEDGFFPVNRHVRTSTALVVNEMGLYSRYTLWNPSVVVPMHDADEILLVVPFDPHNLMAEFVDVLTGYRAYDVVKCPDLPEDALFHLYVLAAFYDAEAVEEALWTQLSERLPGLVSAGDYDRIQYLTSC